MGVLDAPAISPIVFAAQRRRDLRPVDRPVIIGGAADAVPSITLSAANAATGVSNGQRTSPATAGAWRMRGGTYGVYAGGISSMYAITAPTDPPSVSLPIVAETGFGGTQLEFYIQAFGASVNYRLWVDGQIIGGVGATALGVRTATTSGAAGYRLLVDWSGVLPTYGKRRVMLELAGAAFGGATADKSRRLSATAANPQLITAAWLGDSFAEGTNADAGFTSLAYVASQLLGWDNVIRAAQGGTGYLNPSVVSGRGTLRSRVPDVIAQNPDHVVVAGGYNDSGYNPGSGAVTTAQIGAEALLTMQALRAGLPTAKLWALGPWSLGSPVATSRTDIGAVIKAAVESVNGVYVDMFTDPWITGTGSIGTPASPLDGNASLFVTSSSDPHPPQAGHTYYGHEIAAAIAGALAA